MLTDEDRARLLASVIADRLPRVQRITGLPVVSVERVELRPELGDGPTGFLVRVESGRSVIVPAHPGEWRRVVVLLSSLGDLRRFNASAGGRLMRALEEASRD